MFNTLQEVESSSSKLVLTIKCLRKYFNVFVLPKLALKNVVFISKCFAVERYTTFLTQKKLLLNEQKVLNRFFELANNCYKKLQENKTTLKF